MNWVLLGLITAMGAAYPSVRRRHVRRRTVRRVRASLASWPTSDMAAPERPAYVPPTVGRSDTAGTGALPRRPVPAVRLHFELTPWTIEHYRRTA